MRVKALIAAAVVMLAMPAGMSGQYYSNGQAPARQKWNIIRSDSLKMVYPSEFEHNARRTMFYMDSVRPYVNYGFGHAPLRTPVVINTENFFSNGLAMLAPKRIEMIGVPGMETYSNPWLKQLATHEYRHMVQYGNINRSTVKVFSYIFGQQASLLATGLLPFWFLEGDAVMTETQFSEFGRGLQPSFSMHYRAAGRDMLRKRNPDKWFCGSYKDYVPSHYELGYQLVAHSERMYGEYIWDDIARFGADFPFLLFTTQLGLWKYHRTSTKMLFHDTFAYLNDYWDSLPEQEDSAEIISGPVNSYTTYEYPLFIDDGNLLVLKTDYDRSQRFVMIDASDGSEARLCHTGIVSTRPILGDSVVWWTEYRRSALWEQKANSVICYMNVGEWKPRDYPGMKAALYPTPVPGGGVACVEYHYDGRYSITADGISYDFPYGVSLHGLAHDDVTGRLYFIALSDAGMWIGSADLPERGGLPYTADFRNIPVLHDISGRPVGSGPGGGNVPGGPDAAMPDTGIRIVTEPARVSLSNLSAGGGKLYFGSILSGRDEAHMYDLAEGKEYRLSASRYGSFSPSPSPDGGRIALTVYEKDGYKPALHAAGHAEEVAPAHIPANVVNPPIADWGLPKIDSVAFKPSDLEHSETQRPAKRYRKGLNLFNFHSWVPLDANPANMVYDFDFNVNLGATLISQNLLSTAESSFAYGYTRDGYSLLRGNFKYMGIVPKFEVDALWSNSPQTIYKTLDMQPAPDRVGNYFAVAARAYVPIVLTSGYRTRVLTPNVQYLYRNALFYDPFEERTAENMTDYIKGEHRIAGIVSFTDNVRRARLDLLPRWGYALRATVVGDPRGVVDAAAAGIYGRVYTPGLFRHHGLSVAASYQEAFGKGFYRFGALDILPRGHANLALDRYAAVSANYYLPIAYPDWGWSGVFFLKRIYMSLGFDYAWHKSVETTYTDGSADYATDRIYSWGGTLNFDIAPLRLPSEGTCTLSVSLYVPSGQRDPYFYMGFSIPL